MGALAGLDDVVTRVTGGSSGNPESIWFFKTPTIVGSGAAATVANKWTSLWEYDGQPSGGAIPILGATPTNATAGALKQTNAAGGAQKYWLGMSVTCNAPGTLLGYDRLLHIGSMSGTSTGVQGVGGTLTRNTGGVGNVILIEIYAAIGSTSTTITASYTNQAGTTNQTSQATIIGGTGFSEAQRLIWLPLAQGDYGVQAVASVTLAGSTLTAGNFGVTIARPFFYTPIGLASVGCMRDLIMNAPEITPIDANACIAWAWLSNTVALPTFMGSCHFIEA